MFQCGVKSPCRLQVAADWVIEAPLSRGQESWRTANFAGALRALARDSAYLFRRGFAFLPSCRAAIETVVGANGSYPVFDSDRDGFAFRTRAALVTMSAAASSYYRRGVIEMPKSRHTLVRRRMHWMSLIQHYLSAIALCALVAVIWVSWNQYATYHRFEFEFRNVLHVRDKIVELDQVLTVNAVLTVATGDSQWENVYRRNAPLLIAALSEAQALVDHSSITAVGASNSVAVTAAANRSLLEMEHQAISLSNAGQAAEALDVLTSDEYGREKVQFKDGLVALNRSLQQHIANRGRDVADQSFFMGLTAVLVLVLSGAAAILMAIENNKRARLFQGELADHRERLDFAMNSSGIEPWDWNLVTGKVIVSDGFATSLGYDLSELKSDFTSWHELLHPDDKSDVLRAVEQVLQNPDARYESHFRIFRKDGTVMSIIARGRVVERTADGSAARIVGISLDVTDRVLLEAQLVQARRLESLGQLAAGIAHEINTPMQFVSDNIEYLSESCDRLFEVVDIYGDNLTGTSQHTSWQERKRQLVEVMDRNDFATIRAQVPLAIIESLQGIEQVINIVRAMKEFSHQGQQPKLGVDLNNAVRSTVTITRNRWKYVADLTTELDPDLPTLQCVPAEINQVLLNLIVNAADAIGERVGGSGEEKGQIVVRTRLDDSQIILEVSDTGGGIPPEVRGRIFEPFFTTKEIGKGTGQGLAICYSIVVIKHQGSIDVESDVGVGTTFRIRLPIITNQLPDGTPVDHSAIAALDPATV